jgi:hypothetical protein
MEKGLKFWNFAYLEGIHTYCVIYDSSKEMSYFVYEKGIKVCKVCIFRKYSHFFPI